MIRVKYLNTMANLILYNDNVNSCQKVMASLIRYCEHTPLQADQCVLIAHNVGKVNIKTGDFIELLDMKNNLENLGLTVKLIQ